jgi:diguanylate cyclase (GGDEF)-like protein/PAS domain S-box-containing protein
LTDPVKVLLVEDEANDAELVLRLLKRSGLACEGRRVDTERDFRLQLDEFQPHVVLSDFSMPLFDGMAALAVAHHSHPHIPFIFVSGTIGEEYAIRALKNGATDYVLKHDLGRLRPAVDRALQDAKSASEQRRMRAALRHSELRFRLAASTGDVWDWTVETGDAYISHQWKHRLGYEDHEIENTATAWQALLHPEDRDIVLQAFRDHLGKKAPYDVEYRARTRAGEYRWSHAKGQAVWNDGGRATYMAGSVVDITERKLAEIKVRRLNRVYAVLSGINWLIVHTHDRNELFREACRVSVNSGHFLLAWIGMVDGPARRLVPVAWSGIADDHVQHLPLDLAADQPGPCGVPRRVVEERRPVIIEDTAREPGGLVLREKLNLRFRSFAILPIVVSGQVFGTLALYAAEPGFFDEAEMRLLLDLTNDIAFALDHIDKAEKLNYLAYYDALTGLANRALFNERLAQFVEAAKREQHKLAVLSVDIDRFKVINDTLGRQAGDELLKQVAQRLLKRSAEAGQLARVEGDHFSIVIPEVVSEENLARDVMLRAHEYFGAPFQIGDSELRVTARFGIAVFPNDGDDGETLFRNAEAAVKKAHARGERCLFYTQEMTEKIAGTLALENRLRQALEKKEFVLYYQPKVDISTRRILSVEALIRWKSPEHGLVPPVEFIPLMEETGMIMEVGAWALGQAAHDHLRWTDLGIAHPPRIAVNVSQIQLRKKDFVDTVRDAIAEGTDPTGIDLEITESLVMEDIEANIQKLNMIRSLGPSIAIDDFGTGYSSLSYLAKLPVQTLKIDRSFIITMLQEPHTMTLVATVISMAHSLGLKVVAEGVETEAQAAVLLLHGCDEMQGYLYSRPLPLDELTALLLKEGKT